MSDLNFKKKKQGFSNLKKKFGDELGFASREAFNSVRTNIGFVLPGKEGGKIIGVTSPSPQEGKSTVSINLSYSLANSGKTVLLIDADMRRPSVLKYLKLKGGHLGLSNVLGNRAEPQVYENVLTEGLDVLSAGDIPPNPSELLSSSEMGKFLSESAQLYDYIIVDLPPVLSVIDSVAVSKYLDGVVIVLRHQITRKKDVNKAVANLEFSGVRILGFIYNAYRTGFVHYYGKKSGSFSRYSYSSQTGTHKASVQPQKERLK